MQIIDHKTGDGAEAAAGMMVTVHYTGWLFDANAPENKGRKFDSSRDRNDPFQFELGAGMVIQGWEQGLVGVQAGGQYQIDIPSDLGYGDTGSGDVIRPGDDITFVVDIVSVTPAG